MTRRRPSLRAALTAAVVAAGLTVVPLTSLPAWSAPVECTPREAGGPLWVTPDCVDPTYDRPVVDAESELTSPVALHKVSGHFEGTDKRFNFYFPPKEKWQGRFYDKVYPTIDENALPDDLAHGADAGAYTVQTNGGTGYRIDAAAAKFSKTVAAGYYGHTGRIYGYLWGGSGGSYMTISGIENSTGVWDGAVPFVVATPTSIPSNYSTRALARLVLTDRAAQISDAIRPGSKRKPAQVLNRNQRTVLREVTRMGVPLAAWDDPNYLLGYGSEGPQGPAGGTSDLFQFLSAVKAIDSTYADDFWTKPGYLGTEPSGLGNFFRAALVDQVATVASVDRDSSGTPTSVLLDDGPLHVARVPLELTLLGLDGSTTGTVTGTLDPTGRRVKVDAGTPAAVLDALKEGARLRLDNRWTLAYTAYHRYQVPARPGFDAWDQFREADGKPVYPQRPLEVGPLISSSVTGGGTFTGRVNGKVIVVDNLWDTDAFPWQADWYARQVKSQLGNSYDDNFRLWYNDHSDHVDPHSPRLVNYGGLFKQALKDVAAWAEDGVSPARSTRYAVVDSQVRVSPTAQQRRGIQPVVDLTAKHASGHGERITVRVGQQVRLIGRVEVPRRAGAVVATAWDFAGSGTFADVPVRRPRQSLTVHTTHRFDKPGTFFVALRATSQREGDIDNPFTPIYNLDVVRVVVRT